MRPDVILFASEILGFLDFQKQMERRLLQSSRERDGGFGLSDSWFGISGAREFSARDLFLDGTVSTVSRSGQHSQPWSFSVQNPASHFLVLKSATCRNTKDECVV